MVSSAWVLLGIDAAFVCGVMLVGWIVQVAIRDATHVDVLWAYNLGALAVLDPVLADGSDCHRILIGVLVGLWSLRLGTYLVVNRIVRAHGEDRRYQELRAKWSPRANLRFFVFFQAQAGFDLIFSIPILAAVYNHHGPLSALEWAGAALWLVAISGESLADLQLARWKANPENRGKTCRAGLWRYSRHPNYFFEWLIWCAYALIALAADWGWVALFVPAFLLFLLFFVTGIPPAEEAALKSRGDDYRRYQQETSVFVPWFPKRAK